MSSEITYSDNYKANINKYWLFTALMATGGFVLYPRKRVSDTWLHSINNSDSYLVKLPAEEARPGDFNKRLASSAHHPIVAPILSVYVDWLFRQMIQRDHIEPHLPMGFFDDVDLRGTPINLWMSRKYYRGLGHGWFLGLVDKPNNETRFASDYHRKKAGIRPYLEAIMPTRVLQLDLDQFGNPTRVLVQESDRVFRDWRVDRILLITKDEKNRETVLEKINPLGYIPMVLFTADEGDVDIPDCPPGISAIEATSLFDLQILQLSSLLYDVQKKTAFPFLWISADKISDKTLGADFILALNTANVEWISPPTDIPKTTIEHIDWLTVQAKRAAGVHSDAMASTEAHSGLSLDYSNAPIYAKVQRWAQTLKAFEAKLYEIVNDRETR